VTFIVNDGCIRCKFMDCVEVCPVDAFHEGANMLVINPAACIDCGVCEPECPADAIQPDTFTDPRWLELNARLSEAWPVITMKKTPPADSREWLGVPQKFETHFSEASPE